MGRLFPPHLLQASWQRFEAAGYSAPVTGVIYRGQPRPTCGMALGGLDTGCVDIEPNGMLGYSTIFNHLVNPRQLVNLPFLGVQCAGQTWVLVSDRLGKRDTPRPALQPISFPPTDYTPAYFEIDLAGVEIVDSIDYWGHYPVLDMAFNTRAPVGVRRALKYAIVVGAVLIAINHGDALLRGDLDAVRLFRIGLTVVVPYCVSTASSIEAIRTLRRQSSSAA